MNAGKRHSGHWSSIGQWNPLNADTAKRTCHSVRIIRVFIRLITPVSYYVFLALSSADRGLFVSEGGWGEREKKGELAIFRLLSGSLWPGERRLFWGERRLGLGWSARGLKGRDKGRIASKSGCSYQAGSQKKKTVNSWTHVGGVGNFRAAGSFWCYQLAGLTDVYQFFFI